MKLSSHFYIILTFIFIISTTDHCLPPDIVEPAVTSSKADWLIVGAGPAGLCVIGILIDIGIDPQKITWIDPEFSLGRMGAYYSQVPANSDVKEFIKFINACACFQECSS